jgi:DNA modification methylase
VTATTRRITQTKQLALADLTTWPDNPRRGDVAAIRQSLEVSGQYRALVVRAGSLEVLAGNHTLLAMRELGWERALCHLVECDDEQARRIVLADNRTAELAGYDEQALADLLAQMDGDLAGTGWDQGALDELLASLNGDDGAGDDTEPIEPPADPRTKTGDLWLLGEHRLLCGDATKGEDVARLMDGARAGIAFTSPPYADRREYDEASGFKPIPPAEYVEWFEPVAANMAAHLAADGSWFVNIKPGVTPDGLDTELYVLDLVLAHVRRWGWHFATEFCWERTGVPKEVVRRFKNQFEPVYQFARADWKIRPDAARHASDRVPGAEGPARRTGTSGTMAKVQGENHDVGERFGPGLAYPGNHLPTFSQTHEGLGHAAAFPVGLPAFFIRAYTDPGDAVLDPFCGSGSTLIAAHNEARRCCALELSPGYCDVIVDRFERHAGVAATLSP